MTRKPFHLDAREMKSFEKMVEDSLFGRDLDPTLPINPRPRNEEALNSFVAFCRAHPEQRFWQALANWSNLGYILGYNGDIFDLRDAHATTGLPPLRDTFYIEGLDGTR